MRQKTERKLGSKQFYELIKNRHINKCTYSYILYLYINIYLYLLYIYIRYILYINYNWVRI